MKLLGKEQFQSPVGGGLTGCIGVKDQHDLASVSREQSDMLIGQRRPQSSDHIVDPQLQGNQNIEIPFDDDGDLGGDNALARPVQAVHLL